MERKEAANGLQLIKFASIKLRGKFSAVFMGTLAMTTPLILILFMSALFSILFAQAWILSIGVVLFAILVGPLQIGHIKYFNDVLDGKQPRLSVVYSQLRINIFTLRTIYISLLLILMYLLGGVLWIMPAGFAISFYSMVLFFLEKFEYPRLSQAMNECSKKMIGNRLAMFSYKLIFYFVYFMILMVAFLFLMLIYKLSMENLIICWIIALCAAIVIIFIYTLITVYFHSSNQIFFEDVLTRDEKKRMARAKTTVNTTAQLTENKENSVEKIDEKKEETSSKDIEPKKVEKKETKKNKSKTTDTKKIKTKSTKTE